MIGTNDATSKNADEILSEIKDLKVFIEEMLPGSDIVISCPLKRTDHQKAARVVFNLRKKLINLKFPLILNSNITENHLGEKGLHLNRQGAGRLAMNIMNYIRKQ